MGCGEKQELIEYCFKNGYTLVGVYEDCSRIIEAIRSNNADGLLVVSLGMITKNIVELISILKLFIENNWVLISIREDWLNKLDPRVIVSILSWINIIEREYIRERTREAITRLKAQGKHVGRLPKWNSEVKSRILDLLARGFTLKDASRIVGISYSTAIRRLRNDPEYLSLKSSR